MICSLTMSQAPRFRGDIREGGEIIAEHQGGYGSSARVPSPFRFTPRRAECRDFPGPAECRLACSFCAWPRTLFHILPPLVECRVLSCNRPISNSITLRKFHGLRPNRRVDQNDLPRKEVDLDPEGLGSELSNSYTAERTFYVFPVSL